MAIRCQRGTQHASTRSPGMLNIVNAFPSPQLAAAKRSLDTRQYATACAHLQEVLHKEPHNDVALSMLAAAFASQGRTSEAMTFCMQAIRANPSEISYKENLLQWCGQFRVTHYDELVEYALIECLKSGDRLDCLFMGPLWMSHMMATPAIYAAFNEVLAHKTPIDPDLPWNQEKAKLADLRPLLRPCFLLGIKHLVMTIPLFEKFITHVRR